MTEFSEALRRAGNASSTGELPIILMTVAHDLLDAPFRFSADPTVRLSTDPLRYGIVSRGETFDYLPLVVSRPEDGDEVDPVMQAVVRSLGKHLTPFLRATLTPAKVTTEIVLRSSPDIVEERWPDFDLVGARGQGSDVTVTMKVLSLSSEPYPSGRFTPGDFPGLF